MELYSKVSYKSSRSLTLAYSTSFGTSSFLFSPSLRRHIYAIYGLVRVADEIVDTYQGDDAGILLDRLELDTYAAIQRGYDTNPLIHAFAETARRYKIDSELIAPFFKSMRIDLAPATYSELLYSEYIYGSAEVVGLMCLRVFCIDNNEQYNQLKTGASALGAAYQKVNFLRDMAYDYEKLGRVYFPNVTFEPFTEEDKQAIISDIKTDFTTAHEALVRLPKSSRIAVMASYLYYATLLKKLETTSVSDIKSRRIRINNLHKLALLFTVILREGFKK